MILCNTCRLKNICEEKECVDLNDSVISAIDKHCPTFKKYPCSNDLDGIKTFLEKFSIPFIVVDGFEYPDKCKNKKVCNKKLYSEIAGQKIKLTFNHLNDCVNVKVINEENPEGIDGDIPYNVSNGTIDEYSGILCSYCWQDADCGIGDYMMPCNDIFEVTRKICSKYIPVQYKLVDILIHDVLEKGNIKYKEIDLYEVYKDITHSCCYRIEISLGNKLMQMDFNEFGDCYDLKIV